MTNFTIGRWLLVALAIVGFAVAPGMVSAHDTEPIADDAPSDAADDWATWMETHMADHMGPGSVTWMESRTGVPVDEMPRDRVAEYPRGVYGYDYRVDDHPRGVYGHDDYRVDDHPRGVYGQGHCGRP